jgi:hypothetical protein
MTTLGVMTPTNGSVANVNTKRWKRKKKKNVSIVKGGRRVAPVCVAMVAVKTSPN